MDRRITLGSLFDGIGGFPLCAVLSGVTPIWAAEVDAACVALTKQRFPGSVIMGMFPKSTGRICRLWILSHSVHRVRI